MVTTPELERFMLTQCDVEISLNDNQLIDYIPPEDGYNSAEDEEGASSAEKVSAAYVFAEMAGGNDY